MTQNSTTSLMKNVALVNLVLLIAILIFEFLSIFIEIPILFVSEGDAAGVSEFSGTWFDHLIKVFVMGVLVYAIIQGLKNVQSDQKDTKMKGYSFIVGSSGMIIIVGLIFVLIWAAGLLDAAILGELADWIWYGSLRLEMVMIVFNIPIVKNIRSLSA